MTIALIVLLLLALTVAVYALVKNKQLEEAALRSAEEARVAVVAAQAAADADMANQRSAAAEAITEARNLFDRKLEELQREAEATRQHYEAEARKVQERAADLVNKTIKEFEPLKKYASLKDAELAAKTQLAEAMQAATTLRAEAEAMLQKASYLSIAEQNQATQKARAVREEADALLNQATRDAGRIVAEAEKRAEQMAGDAYTALRDKQLLEQAAEAIRNVVEGYGDRYVIPTHSLLDDLAAEFGYDAAGSSLKSAREQSRRMVVENAAAACDYVEANRRDIAVRFVIDAFNGRVDAIQSRAKHDNFGTLEQEIRDAYSLVNLNGEAFRNARILPAYLDARLAELRWAVVVNELARKQRDEQRELRERIRDEEKARKEFEEQMRQAAHEEELKRRAVAEAEQKFAGATADQKAKYESELKKLREDLIAATERALTIAQQTKKGHVYIISNIGAFGEGVFKIGQTRRPDPQERIDELGDASVPFEFDIHALIESENAPALEHKIHKKFLSTQVNKINSRKEFFRVGLAEIRAEVENLKQGADFTVKIWTEKAIATEFMETRDIESNPDKKQKWLARQKALADRQIRMDSELSKLVSTTTNGPTPNG